MRCVRRIGGVFVAMACLALAGCTSLGGFGGQVANNGITALTCALLNGPQAATATKRFNPVIVGEVAVRCALEVFAGSVEREIATSGGKLSDVRARALSGLLDAQMQPVGLSRLVYDSARRPGASQEERDAVDAARGQTDAAYTRAQKRLAEFFVSPTPI